MASYSSSHSVHQPSPWSVVRASPAQADPPELNCACDFSATAQTSHTENPNRSFLTCGSKIARLQDDLESAHPSIEENILKLKEADGKA
uniref:Uncharacterized protein n=1 Tax=Oryza nivara TaxID=4536 RepID=A0A0E0J4J8_ORYNI